MKEIFFILLNSFYWNIDWIYEYILVNAVRQNVSSLKNIWCTALYNFMICQNVLLISVEENIENLTFVESI